LSFTEYLVDNWNALPQSAVDVISILSFTQQLSIYLYEMLQGFNKSLVFSPWPTQQHKKSGI